MTIIEKIQALLAKANNTACTEQEAQAFNAKAHELMLKYNIERAQLDTQEKQIERGHVTLEVQRRPWSENVLSGITKLYYCKWYSTAKGRTHTITIIGEKHNLAMCHAICVMVLRSIQVEARRTGLGRSFMNGAGSEVYRRCCEMYDAAHHFLPGAAQQALLTNQNARALVALTTTEAQGNQDYMARVLNVRLRVRKSAGPKALNSDAFFRGVDHGAKQQLRRNLLGNG